MKRKVGMVLLSMFLCLVMGFQSMEKVQASVNYEACPYCGTRVDRGEKTKVLNMTHLGKCGTHIDCDIYEITYGSFSTISCETVGCSGYDKEIELLYSWKNEKAHVTQH